MGHNFGCLVGKFEVLWEASATLSSLYFILWTIGITMEFLKWGNGMFGSDVAEAIKERIG